MIKERWGWKFEKICCFSASFPALRLCGAADSYQSGCGDRQSPRSVLSRYKKALLEVPGVADSAVVVAGHTAIIGLRTKETGTSLGRLIQEAERAARNADQNLQMVSVTANDAIVDRMEETAEGT